MAPRLFVDSPLTARSVVELDRQQANYILAVLRLGPGDEVLIFNGRDGEWRSRLEVGGRKSARLEALERLREQPEPTRLVLLFAPLKQARLDYVIQKAVEMGAGQICPVLTQRTQVSRLNLERAWANAIEAAEQCGVLTIPSIRAPESLDAALAQLDPAHALVFCDEDVEVADPVAVLRAATAPIGAVLIGPEGGFSPEERSALRSRAGVVTLSLGPRILRADTAAVAAMALIQATCGDWIG